MKPGAYLVNTARGAIVDIDALTGWSESRPAGRRRARRAAPEPIEADHPLLADPRVILSPHSAFYSVASEIELRRKAAMNIVELDEDRTPRLSGSRRDELKRSRSKRSRSDYSISIFRSLISPPQILASSSARL